MPRLIKRASHAISAARTESSVQIDQTAIDVLLREFEEASSEFSELADGVSGFLRGVEGRLVSLSARIEAQVGCIDGYYLSFERCHGDWSLFLRPRLIDAEDTIDAPDDFITPVTEASLEQKVVAVRLMPMLLQELTRKQRTTLEVLRGCQPLLEEFSRHPASQEQNTSNPPWEGSYGNDVPF